MSMIACDTCHNDRYQPVAGWTTCPDCLERHRAESKKRAAEALRTGYTVWGPERPGVAPSPVGTRATLDEAWELAQQRFGHRRDLNHGSVRIEHQGRRVQYAGPQR